MPHAALPDRAAGAPEPAGSAAGWPALLADDARGRSW